MADDHKWTPVEAVNHFIETFLNDYPDECTYGWMKAVGLDRPEYGWDEECEEAWRVLGKGEE